MLTKICGVTTPEALDAAIQHGASHIGLVHFAASPRHVDLNKAADLRRRAGDRVKTVLLLVDASPAVTVHAYQAVRPDVIQLHGGEPPQWAALLKQNLPAEIWKAMGLRDAATLEDCKAYHGIVDRILFDSPAQALPGGTGTRFDWSLLANHRHDIDWGIAGGLNPDNVAAAIAATGAPMVDASSGLESAPGVKDVDKIAAFLKAARA